MLYCYLLTHLFKNVHINLLTDAWFYSFLHICPSHNLHMHTAANSVQGLPIRPSSPEGLPAGTVTNMPPFNTLSPNTTFESIILRDDDADGFETLEGNSTSYYMQVGTSAFLIHSSNLSSSSNTPLNQSLDPIHTFFHYNPFTNKFYYM